MSIRQLLALSFLFLAFAVPLGGHAETIALIGTGDVSAAFGPRYAALGHRVIYGSRSPDRDVVKAMVEAAGGDASAALPHEAAAQADIVMLNVPWEVAEDVIKGLGDLSGKIIIDPVNPRVIADDGYRDYPGTASNAERIQNLAPGAFVVKAFNTISMDTMLDPHVNGHPVTIPLVGNDATAKRKVAGLVEALGYEVVDVGPVRFAHIVEGLYLLRSNTRDRNGVHYEYHFRLRETATPQTVR
ncbi:MAG: NAD(P)-binding domain-containing protein [Gammaproteobacteria bacterium]|nr:NAD(P)-binding domain-containing protein [Gammaproteobacteria bacterium]